MFERFTERARQVVVIAQEEARSLRHNYIGTEHILLGLLREEDQPAARVLSSFGLTLDGARAQVLGLVGSGDEPAAGQIPFTPRAKKVLELALREALALGHDYIGTEHILLGLLRDDEGVAGRVLLAYDADRESVRGELLRLLPAGEGQHQRQLTTSVVRSEFAVTIGPDRDLRRLLRAAAGRALTAERSEFGLADVLAAAKEEAPDASAPEEDREAPQ